MTMRFPRLVLRQVLNGFTVVGATPKRVSHSIMWKVRHTCGAVRWAQAGILHYGEVSCVCVGDLPAISSVDAAWLAAAIDGEGTICFSLHLKPTKPGGLSFRAKPNIAVSNTVRAYTERAQEAAGCGSICKAKPLKGFRSVGYARKGAYFSWDLSVWAHVEQVLRACIPHLVIKHAKARAMLACCVRRRALRVDGNTRLAKTAVRRFARYVHDRYLRRFQNDGRAIEHCRRFLAFTTGRGR